MIDCISPLDISVCKTGNVLALQFDRDQEPVIGRFAMMVGKVLEADVPSSYKIDRIKHIVETSNFLKTMKGNKYSLLSMISENLCRTLDLQEKISDMQFLLDLDRISFFVGDYFAEVYLGINDLKYNDNNFLLSDDIQVEHLIACVLEDVAKHYHMLRYLYLLNKELEKVIDKLVFFIENMTGQNLKIDKNYILNLVSDKAYEHVNMRLVA